MLAGHNRCRGRSASDSTDKEKKSCYDKVLGGAEQHGPGVKVSKKQVAWTQRRTIVTGPTTLWRCRMSREHGQEGNVRPSTAEVIHGILCNLLG